MQSDAPAGGVNEEQNDRADMRLLASVNKERSVKSGHRFFSFKARWQPVFSHILNDVVMRPCNVAQPFFSERANIRWFSTRGT